MPIFVNDYEWHQNGLIVTLKLELLGRKSKNVDIVFTSSYIKVNFSPYLFEAFLSHKIDPTLSSSTFKDDLLYFNLVKVSNQEWDSFSVKPFDKKKTQMLRNEALEEYNLLQISKVENKQGVIQELSKLAISKQIEVNEKQNEQFKNNLLKETKIFFNDDNTVNDISIQEEIPKEFILRTRSVSTCSEEGSCNASEGDYDGDEESVCHSSFENIPALANKKFKEVHFKAKEMVVQEIEGPRQCSVIKIHHSIHKFGVPKRKSTSYMPSKVNDDDKIVLELEKKGAIDSAKAENLQVTKVNNNIQPIEENVEELSYDKIKREAKHNFENDKHEEAIRLYSITIKMHPNHASNYSNRAASYLALNSNGKAIKDCTKAIKLLEPPSQENLKSLLLCFIRRGTAYVRLCNYQKGLIDYKAALHLDPENDSLVKDINEIILFLNISSDTGEDNSGETDGSNKKKHFLHSNSDLKM